MEGKFREGRDFHLFIDEPLDLRMCLTCNKHSIHGLLGVKNPKGSGKDSKRK